MIEIISAFPADVLSCGALHGSHNNPLDGYSSSICQRLKVSFLHVVVFWFCYML